KGFRKIRRKKSFAMVPTIACIGIIGRSDNPLHISLFPPYMESRLEFSFLLNSCLDILETRQKQTSVDQDLGLLHAVDERLSVYGWLMNTGIKLLIVVDLAGKPTTAELEKRRGHAVSTLKDLDLKPAFRALQNAYIQLLQNPFYSPDAHIPNVKATTPKHSPCSLSNRKFLTEVKRIGDSWVPGIAIV
ncbi:Sedlin, partial [Elaphomyces granulatus]